MRREADCDLCRERKKREKMRRATLAVEVVDAILLRSIDSWRRFVPGAVDTLRLPARRCFFSPGRVGWEDACAASIALQLARAHPDRRYTLISVDRRTPSERCFAQEKPPPNLTVETIDTRAKWQHLRATLGDEIERAVNALTPGNFTLAYDADAMKKLLEISPPGADELFAVTRLADLAQDESVARVVVDTAPTGHFLRLLELPHTAGEWVREFMRILLRYRELIPAGTLGQELVTASRSLHALEESLRSERSTVIVVTRPERIVLAETQRLIEELERRKINVAAVIANYVTPENDCPCDRSMRTEESERLARSLGAPALSEAEGSRPETIIPRQDQPVTTLDNLARSSPLRRLTAMPDSVLYVYASPASPRSAVEAIDQSENYGNVRAGGVSAVFTPVSQEAFSQDAIDRRAGDLEWLGEIGYRHQAVIAHLMRDTAVIPLRAFTLFSGEEALKRYLADNATHLGRVLQRLDGKQEWTLRVEFDPQRWHDALISRVDSLRDLQQQIDSAAPGKAFLLRKKCR